IIFYFKRPFCSVKLSVDMLQVWNIAAWYKEILQMKWADNMPRQVSCSAFTPVLVTVVRRSQSLSS
ncbi:hypothetical protein, partial [Klebsiella pneumoniae]